MCVAAEEVIQMEPCATLMAVWRWTSVSEKRTLFEAVKGADELVAGVRNEACLERRQMAIIFGGQRMMPGGYRGGGRRAWGLSKSESMLRKMKSRESVGPA